MTEITPEQLHADRKDLVKRLFAVAISVGFAARVVGLDRRDKPLTCVEWEQVVFLITALLVVLLCWDWYHRDIERIKYKYVGRFLLDVALTFAYLMFLYSAGFGLGVWSFFLFFIFILFVTWDILAIWEHPREYGCNARRGFRANVASVYDDGQNRPSSVNRAPYVNFCWMLYFFGVWAFGQHSAFPSSTDQPACSLSEFLPLMVLQRTLIPCVFVLAGILFLRCDGNAQGEQKYARWNKMRPIIILILLALYAGIPRLIDRVV